MNSLYNFMIFESFFQIFLLLSALLQPMFNNHPSGQLIEAVMFLFPDSYTRGNENAVYQFKTRASMYMIVISIVTSLLSWILWLKVMAIRVVEFSSGGYKIGKSFA